MDRDLLARAMRWVVPSDVLNEGAVLERLPDRVRFRVVELGHWSTIRSESGEEDKVKWFGIVGERMSYVSASKGFTYVLV